MKIFPVVAILFAVTFASVGRAQTYHLTDLGLSIGTNSYAQGINNQGEIVGFWINTNGDHAFLYQGGAVTDLGLLGAGGTNNYALRINNAGQVVGFSETTNGAQAFIFQNGGTMNLGSQGNLGSYAFGINGSGQVAGYFDTSNGARAFLYNNGIFFNIGTLGGTNSFAYGVNEAMQVAGSSLEADNVTLHAFLWGNGIINDLNQLVPPTSGWDLSDARGINDYGDIAGSGVINGQQHGFLYFNGGSVVDLGSLPNSTNSYALDLNNSNQVVGAANLGAGTHAILWENGRIEDLNSLVDASGWELEEACGINDLGQVVGWGISNSMVRAFLLTPPTTNLKLAAVDSSSRNPTSQSQSLFSPNLTSFTVTITNPVANASFNGPTNLQINAVTSDSVGTVTQLQFYVGTRLLGTQTSSPNSIVWTNANAGVHALTVMARDNTGLAATSSVVTVSISTNLTPVADVYVRDGSYTNSNFSATNILECLTTSTNGNNRDVYFMFNLAGMGTISSAQLEAYGRLSSSSTVSNTVYSVTNTSWTETNITWSNKPSRVTALITNILSGTNWFAFNIGGYVKTQQAAGQNLVSVALHDLTNSATLTTFNSTVNTTNKPYLVVFATNNPLSIVITNPANNALLVGPTNLTINASVSDSDGVVTQVQFFQGATILGLSTSPPYGMVWSNVNNGTYVLTAVAIDNSGVITTSSAVNVTVDILPSLTLQPTNETVMRGSNAIFVAAATGTTPLSYKWLFNGTNLAGANSTSLTITNAQSTNAGNYSFSVSNAVGSVISSNAVLSVLVPPSITLQPTNQTLNQSSNATFVVAATGTTPLAYHWFFNSTNLIPGGTNGSLTVSNAQAASDGYYSAVITNIAGSVTSSNVLLTVRTPPVISVQPTNQTTTPGGSVTFAVAATGATPLLYQWRLNGANVSKATNTSFSISNAQSTNAGTYSVVITNTLGSITSSNAVLVVKPPPVVSITNPPNNSVMTVSSNITLSATATDSGGVITQVQFFVGTNSLGILTNAPYTMTWSNLVTGNYALTVRASDNYGLTTTSAVVNVTLVTFQAVNALALWLNASAITGITNGGSISSWLDSSGNSNNATQSSSTYKPVYRTNTVNGLPVVHFNGTNSYMSLPGFESNYVQGEIFVFLRVATNLPTKSAQAWLFGSGANGNPNGSYSLYPDTNGAIQEGFGLVYTEDQGVPVQPITQFHMYDFQMTTQLNYGYNINSSWINGAPLALNSSICQFANNPRLGASSSSFGGDIAELFVFNRALTGAERDSIGDYLSQKYAFLALPTTPATPFAYPLSTTQIRLAWTPNTQPAEITYIINRRTAGGSYQQVGSATNLNLFIDNGLAPGTQYFYKIQAQNYAGISGFSAEVNATTFSSGAAVPIDQVDLWFQADMISALTNGASINDWPDSLGRVGADALNYPNGDDAEVGPLYITNALNGNPVAEFVTNCCMALPDFDGTNDSADLFVVIKAGDPAPSYQSSPWELGGGVLSSAVPQYPASDGSIRDDFASTAYNNAGVPPEPLTQYNIFEESGSNGNWSASINGGLLARITGNTFGYTGGEPGTGGPRLLGSAVNYDEGDYNYTSTYFNGDIAEIITFKRQLSDNEKQCLESYLNSKYAIVSTNLPTPTNLVARPISSYQAYLQWSPITANVAFSYAVEREVGTNGDFVTVALVNQTSFIDNQLSPGTNYFYRIQAQSTVPAFPAQSGYGNLAGVTPFLGVNDLPMTNLVMWLSADFIQGLSNGDLVTNWMDLSGFSDNAVQTNSVDDPIYVTNVINGEPAVRFVGGGQELLLTNFASVISAYPQGELFIVLKADTNSPATNSQSWELGGSGAPSFYPATNGLVSDDFGSVRAYTFVPPVPITSYHIYDVSVSCEYTGSLTFTGPHTWTARLNDINAYSTPTSTLGFSSSPSIGYGSNSFGGDLLEVMVFNRSLVDNERDAVAGYLNQKYNITVITNAPTDLTATAISSSQISLVWSTVQGAPSTIFQIERKAGVGGTYTVVGTIRDHNSYVDSELSAGTQYYYRVSASCFAGTSEFSNETNATTLANDTPIPAGDLMLWLRADAGILTNNGSISEWEDQGTNDENAIQNASGTSPTLSVNALNGLPVVHFNGSDDFYIPGFMAYLNQAEVFVVLRVLTNKPTSDQSLWGDMGGGYSADSFAPTYPDTTGQINDNFGSSTMHASGVPNQPIYQYHIYNVDSTSSEWINRINGSYQSGTTINAFEGAIDNYSFFDGEFGQLGGSDYYPFIGDIAEVMVFDRALTGDERDAVGQYLNQKYLLVTNAPASPAYVNADSLSASQISLTWNSALGTQYLIERKTGTNGTYAQIASVRDTLSFIDSGLAPQTQYFYQVCTVNYAGTSAYSSEVSATTQSAESDVPVNQLLLWLKADSQGWTNGTPMSTWPDISGNRNDATNPNNPPVCVTNAVNGKPALYFNANAYLTLPNFLNSATQAEMFVVLKSDIIANSNQGAFEFGTSGESYPTNDGTITEDFGTGTGLSLGTPLSPLNEYNIYDIEAGVTNWVACFDGTTLLSTTNDAFSFSSSPTLGESPGAGDFSGDIAEVLVFNAPLTPWQRSSVETYLNQRYLVVTAPPSAPVLTIATNTTASITLSWAIITNASGFLIERAIGTNGTYGVIATLPFGSETNYTDANLSAGIPYIYEIQAMNIAGTSPPSNPVSLPVTSSGDIESDELYDYLIGIDATEGSGGDNSVINLDLYTSFQQP